MITNTNVMNIFAFKHQKSAEQEATYTGNLEDAETLKAWANDKANPLVREITFENGEELTEEGLPFLLLFHKPDDVTSIQRFKSAVMRELMHERGSIFIIIIKIISSKRYHRYRCMDVKLSFIYNKKRLY